MDMVNPCKEKRKGARCILGSGHPPVRRDLGRDGIQLWDHIASEFYWNWNDKAELKRPPANKIDPRNFSWVKAYEEEGVEV